MYQELTDLAPEETLVCIFFRGEGQPADELAVTDFERRPGSPLREGGISYFRRDLVTYATILGRVKRKPLLNRGFASVTVDQLRVLGFRVYGNRGGDFAHVCLHCGECNGAEHDCSPHTGPCPFVAQSQPYADDDAVRRRLLESMTVFIEATSREKLLEIFGSDLGSNDPKGANALCEERWVNHKNAPVK